MPSLATSEPYVPELATPHPPTLFPSSPPQLKASPLWLKMPAWFDLSKEDATLLGRLSAQPLDYDRVTRIMCDDGAMIVVARILESARTSGPSEVGRSGIHWLILLLHELSREDAFRLERMISALEHRSPLYDSLNHWLQIEQDRHMADRTASLLTSMIAHDLRYRSASSVEHITSALVGCKTKCTNAGVLASIANILKVPKFRAHLWNLPGVHILVRASLNIAKADPSSQYQAVLCTWLFSMNSKFIPHLVESGIFSKMLQLFKEKPHREKIIRPCIEILANSLSSHDALAVLIEFQIQNFLDVLLFEKWRSLDLYDRITDTSARLTKALREWSTFERYERELDTGRLAEGSLHQAEFWGENILRFEEKEFLAVRKLVTLLRSRDPVTLALACRDLGEFARLHPLGKKILNKLNARDMILALSEHASREVERESLLAVQKMMLDRWEF